MGVRLKGGRTAPLENSGGLDRWLAVRLCAAGEESAHGGKAAGGRAPAPEEGSLEG